MFLHWWTWIYVFIVHVCIGLRSLSSKPQAGQACIFPAGSCPERIWPCNTSETIFCCSTLRLMEERWKNTGQQNKLYHSASLSGNSQSQILNRPCFKSMHKKSLPGTVFFSRWHGTGYPQLLWREEESML